MRSIFLYKAIGCSDPEMESFTAILDSGEAIAGANGTSVEKARDKLHSPEYQNIYREKSPEGYTIIDYLNYMPQQIRNRLFRQAHGAKR